MSQHLEKLADGFDVEPVLAQLANHPELWNVYHERRIGPHRDASDIWVRYFDRDVLTGPEAYRERHPLVFYPAWSALPGLKPIVKRLIDIEQAHQLGGILITKIPSGGVVDWHHDRGSWHAEYFDRKLYVPLKSNSRCVNYVGTERCVMHAGSAWYFNNLVDHAVENNGDTDRLTLIVCLRRIASLADLADDWEASLRAEGARHGKAGGARHRDAERGVAPRGSERIGQ
jgi:hypothetical protein